MEGQIFINHAPPSSSFWLVLIQQSKNKSKNKNIPLDGEEAICFTFVFEVIEG